VFLYVFSVGKRVLTVMYLQEPKLDIMKQVYGGREEKELHDLFLKHSLPQKVCNDILKIVSDVSTTPINYDICIL
jgi:hypothetical protein